LSGSLRIAVLVQDIDHGHDEVNADDGSYDEDLRLEEVDGHIAAQRVKLLVSPDEEEASDNGDEQKRRRRKDESDGYQRARKVALSRKRGSVHIADEHGGHITQDSRDPQDDKRPYGIDQIEEAPGRLHYEKEYPYRRKNQKLKGQGAFETRVVPQAARLLGRPRAHDRKQMPNDIAYQHIVRDCFDHPLSVVFLLL